MTLKYALSSCSLLFLSGCATLTTHGHEIDPLHLKQVKIGQTTKKKVTEMFGTPSAVSTFNNNVWFYISDTTSTRAFFSPKVLKSNVTCIEFNEAGLVQGLDSLTEADQVIIAHIRRTTPTSGHKFGVVEQMFGNIGRFNGKDPDMGQRGH